MDISADSNPAGNPPANAQNTTAISKIGEGDGTGKTYREQK
jgi:hypothetical protein